jgi:hypothetical protein
MKINIPSLNKDIRVTFRYENNNQNIYAFIKEIDPALATTGPDGRHVDGYSTVHVGTVKRYVHDSNNKVIGRRNALLAVLHAAKYSYQTRQEILKAMLSKGFRLHVEHLPKNIEEARELFYRNVLKDAEYDYKFIRNKKGR